VFSHTGIGTLIYANEYLAIRQAQRRDIHALYALIRIGIENDELLQRSLYEIETQLEDFYVFEIDQMPAGCVALHWFPHERKAEMACMCVHPRYENQKIGQRLMTYAENRARELGAQTLFCLSTQAFNYFVQKGGFHISTPDELPTIRRQRYEQSGRNSLVLAKAL
jgi:amino-acid N-acetyltransferase